MLHQIHVFCILIQLDATSALWKSEFEVKGELEFVYTNFIILL